MSENRLMYHTQESREKRLIQPIKCVRENAWLGHAYYFWDDVKDAEVWGEFSKKRTGQYEIYISDINCSNILDTVFNEEHYRFWLKQIEKAAMHFVKKTGKKPTLYEINSYFKERAQWSELDGILFQDLPQNHNMLLVKEFYYRKRIQLAAYTLHIINTFAFLKTGRCQ